MRFSMPFPGQHASPQRCERYGDVVVIRRGQSSFGHQNENRKRWPLAHDSSATSSACPDQFDARRPEEHTSELQSLMRISYAVFCLKKKNTEKTTSKSKIERSTYRERIRQ